MLEAAGGPVPLSDVVADLTTRFSVTGNSVVAYASAPPYGVEKGLVDLRGRVSVPTRGPEKSKRWFRRGEAWVYRLTDTTDHLRGSGFPAQLAVANVLGLKPGQHAERPSRLGTQSFTWVGLQPAVGTIRRFLEADDVAAGAETFLVYADDGSFDVVPLEPEPEAPLARALWRVGADVHLAGDEAVAALASAVGLPGGDREAVTAALRARGDGDLYELLVDA